MLKGSYITLFFMCLASVSFAQNATLTINETVLLSGHATIDASGYNYNSGIGVLPNVMVRSVSSSLAAASGSNTIPISHFTVAIIKNNTVGGTITLSTSSQQITGSLLGLLLSSGPFSVRYSAPNLSAFAWQAGNYTTTLDYTASSIGIGTSVSPTAVMLNVVVPGFIAALNQPGDITLSVNDLNYFRNTPLSANEIISNSHTVPLVFSLKGSTSLFTFSNGHNGIQSPQTNINLVNARMTAPVQGAQIALSNTLQAFSTVNIPIGNTTTNTAQFSISPANLRTGFINKGTYTNTLNLEVKDANGNYPAATYNKSLNLNVIVSDLAELTINTSNIKLSFKTADNYRNGVAVDAVNHLVLSRTTPYDVTVKSDNANFSFGVNTIPVSVLSIGPASGQTGVNTISSLSTQSQVLISAASPVVDKAISLRYNIPASKTQNLLNKQAGTYTANVIYTLTAH